ncbi:MAG: cyanophycinase [Flavobacterium sp.]|nr:MAG: cyanophycinase [Flavobacterium sp.]
MRYKGKLVIIGGAEDKGISKDESPDFKIDGILERIVQESSKKKKSRVEIVTTASQVPEQIGNDYIKAFGKLGVDNVHVLNLEHREHSREQKFIKAIQNADVVFFTGGDQLRLTSLLGGSPVLDTIREKLVKEHFIYAGTSAGAAAASDAMIFEGNSTDALLKGEIRISSGFGLVENVVFDTHFINRGRIGRLFQAVVSNPKLLGIGLEENTGLLFTGNKMEAIGPGMTILIDGRHIRNSNLLEIKDGVPISIDNLTLHVMSKTDVYDLEKHELTIVTPEDCRI